MMVRDLEQKLDDTMIELPEQCRTIFQLSKFEELKYLQIHGLAAPVTSGSMLLTISM